MFEYTADEKASSAALREYLRIRELPAFVAGHESKRKVNQHLTVYRFADGTQLAIFSNGVASVLTPEGIPTLSGCLFGSVAA